MGADRGNAQADRRNHEGRRRSRFWPLVTTLALAGSILSATSAAPTSFLSPAGAATDLSLANVKLTQVASGLTLPVALAWRTGDTRMYVAEQGGKVKAVFGGVIRQTVLTVTVGTGGERGLLGLVFSPDGTKLYVDYTDVDGHSRIEEYQFNGTTAVVSTKRLVLFQTQPFSNHNGGQLAFGPDGMLYISFGDGGGAGDPSGNGQNLGTKLGKILRIDPRPLAYFPYRIPADNPYATSFTAKREIWMRGLRNPWKFSFDKVTGAMWIGDVGQALYEEIDYAAPGEKGTNWGWKLREGNHAYTGARPVGNKDPILEMPHTAGDCSVIGGYVYRGFGITNLTGAYVYSDFCTGKIMAMTQSGGVATATRDLGLTVDNPTAFGQSNGGSLYVVERLGKIFRLDQGA